MLYLKPEKAHAEAWKNIKLRIKNPISEDIFCEFRIKNHLQTTQIEQIAINAQ